MDFATTNFRHVRVVEITPARNIASCVSIGIGGKPTQLTRELVACRSVLLADAPARRTCSAGVAWVHKFNRYPDKPALVANLRLEISERPRVQDAALLFRSPDPRANVRQIFERNSPLRAFSNTANLFGNDVVHVAHKSFFSTADSAQNFARLLRALLLKPLSLPKSPIADTSNLASITESLPVGTLGEIDKSKVNSKPSDSLLFLFFRHIHSYVEIPLTVAQNKIRLAFWKFKQFALTFTADKREMLQSAFDSPDAHHRSGKLEVKNAGVVGNATVLSKGALNFLVQLVGVRHLCVKTHYDLRGQIKFHSNLFVKQSVHWKLPELLFLPSKLGQTASRLIS